jgi:hypothetical protein
MPLTENPPAADEAEITPEQQVPTSRGNLPQALIDKINATAKAAQPDMADKPPEPAPAATPDPAKPADPAAPAATTPPAEPAKPESKGLKSVREALERAEKRAKDLEDSVNATAKEKAEAFAKVAALQEELTTTKKRIAEDLEPRAARLEQREKELQEAQDHLRMVDFTKSPQWSKEYVQPIADTQSRIQTFLSDIFATVNGQDVPATMEHFNAVLGAPNGTVAMERAKALFGPDFAAQAVGYRADLRALQQKQSEALKNAHAESMEWHKQQQAAQAQAQEQFRNTLYQRESHYEAGWKPADDDQELRAAYLEGQELADLATVGKPGMSREQLADAAGRARALVKKAFVADKQLARLKKENDELRQQLTRYQKSEPDVETRSDPTARSDKVYASDEQRRAALSAELRQKAATKYATPLGG